MTAEQFHQRIWEILEDLNSDYFQVVAAPAPEPQAVAAAEALTGVPVPAYYSAFCQRTNGLCVMAGRVLAGSGTLFCGTGMDVLARRGIARIRYPRSAGVGIRHGGL